MKVKEPSFGADGTLNDCAECPLDNLTEDGCNHFIREIGGVCPTAETYKIACEIADRETASLGKEVRDRESAPLLQALTGVRQAFASGKNSLGLQLLDTVIATVRES